MQCEVCGQRIIGKPRIVIIEGAKMMVCERCSSLGSPYIEPEAKKGAYPTVLRRRLKKVTAAKKPSPRMILEDLEVVEDFGRVVRKARERMNLSHEDLGRRIGEKVSVLKKVESGRMIPDLKLARKLEHALKIKLLVPPPEGLEAVKVPHPPNVEPTLGDVVHLKMGKAEKRRT